jgi:hypothetical protein
MGTMIDWLNDNSGAVQAFAVLALVIVTSMYAYFTKRMANEIRQQTLAQDQPYLLIDVEVTGEWHEPGPDDEQPETQPWLHTYPKSVGCRVHNAGRGPAKEVVATIIHPGVLFRAPTKGFVISGETWPTQLHADPIMQYLSGKDPQGLNEWLAENAEHRQQPTGSSYNAGAVVLYRDIHSILWVTYLVLGLWEATDNTTGKVTDRGIKTGKQSIVRLKQK